MRPYRLALLGCLAPLLSQAAIEGDWNGTLQAGAIPLRLALHLSRESDGTITGTLDSLDQNARGIPISKVTQESNSLTLEIKAVGATFEGKLNSEGTEISGTLHQNGQNLPLTFRRGPVPELVRPQNPVRPFPYDEEEVAFENQKAGVRLAGTLTLPRSGAPHPAALLITGSGPQDRDETVMGHKPFLVIADYLTRRGLAVLRVDDRGTGKSTGKFAQSTTMDFAGDARAGLDFLMTRKDIDAHRIGLIGHSEGAVIAPMLAAQSSDIGFIVMLAGPGIPGEALLIEQQYLVNKAAGMSAEALQRFNDLERAVLDIIMHETDEAAAERKIHDRVEALLNQLPESQREGQRGMLANLEKQMKLLQSPWFKAFLSFDPRPTLEKVKAPVLAMNGELDLQVPPKHNLPAIAAALEAGGNPDYQVLKLPHLNHLFQHAKTGSPMEYPQIEETFAPVALEVMAQWIERHIK